MDPDTEMTNTKLFGKNTGHTKLLSLCHSSLDELESSMANLQSLTLIAVNEIIQYRDLLMRFENLRDTAPFLLTQDHGQARNSIVKEQQQVIEFNPSSDIKETISGLLGSYHAL